MLCSNTTASTPANALFYLARCTDVQSKLRKLLDEVMPLGYTEWSYTAVKNISNIHNVITETLRLKPPVIQGVPRETLAQGLQISDVWVPGHVNVLVPTISIQRDSRWWKKPNEFVPKHWGDCRDEMGTHEASWLPFQRGMHHCAGKDLAYLTFRTTLSAINHDFQVSFALEESEEGKTAFDERFLSSMLMTLRPLHLIFTARHGR